MLLLRLVWHCSGISHRLWVAVHNEVLTFHASWLKLELVMPCREVWTWLQASANLLIGMTSGDVCSIRRTCYGHSWTINQRKWCDRLLFFF